MSEGGQSENPERESDLAEEAKMWFRKLDEFSGPIKPFRQFGRDDEVDLEEEEFAQSPYFIRVDGTDVVAANEFKDKFEVEPTYFWYVVLPTKEGAQVFMAQKFGGTVPGDVFNFKMASPEHLEARRMHPLDTNAVRVNRAIHDLEGKKNPSWEMYTSKMDLIRIGDAESVKGVGKAHVPIWQRVRDAFGKKKPVPQPVGNR